MVVAVVPELSSTEEDDLAQLLRASAESGVVGDGFVPLSRREIPFRIEWRWSRSAASVRSASVGVPMRRSKTGSRDALPALVSAPIHLNVLSWHTLRAAKL